MKYRLSGCKIAKLSKQSHKVFFNTYPTRKTQEVKRTIPNSMFFAFSYSETTGFLSNKSILPPFSKIIGYNWAATSKDCHKEKTLSIYNWEKISHWIPYSPKFIWKMEGQFLIPLYLSKCMWYGKHMMLGQFVIFLSSVPFLEHLLNQLKEINCGQKEWQLACSS